MRLAVLPFYLSGGTTDKHGLRGFSVGGSHQVARAEEARPLRLGWAYAAVAPGIRADHEPGCDRRQQAREFGDVPSRALFEFLEYPLADPRLGAVDACNH